MEIEIEVEKLIFTHTHTPKRKLSAFPIICYILATQIDLAHVQIYCVALMATGLCGSIGASNNSDDNDDDNNNTHSIAAQNH